MNAIEQAREALEAARNLFNYGRSYAECVQDCAWKRAEGYDDHKSEVYEQINVALTALRSHAEQVQQLTAENERLEECRKHWREAEATRMQDCIQANAERDAALAEVAKLKDVIRHYIKWWYEPRNYADHSEGAYNKLRTALTESEAKDVSTQA